MDMLGVSAHPLTSVELTVSLPVCMRHSPESKPVSSNRTAEKNNARQYGLYEFKLNYPDKADLLSALVCFPSYSSIAEKCRVRDG